MLDPQERLHLFLTHLKAGRKQEANRILADTLAADPSKAAPYALLVGGLLAQNGQYEDAVPLYQEAKRLNPSEPAAYFYLGLAFHALKKEKESHQVWDDLAERFQNHAFDHYQRGLRLLTSHQLTEAKKALEQALHDFDPQNFARKGVLDALRAIDQKLNTK